jgi:hypothetical protein
VYSIAQHQLAQCCRWGSGGEERIVTPHERPHS